MRIEPRQYKAFLLDSNLITEKEFNEALAISKKEKKKLGDVLISANKISEEDLARLQGYILGIPFVNLENVKVEPEILHIIPEPIARTHNVVAFRKEGKNLEVAMLDPEDLETIEFIKKKSDLAIKPRLTNSRSMKNMLAQYQKSLEAEFGEIIKGEASAMEYGGKESGGEEETQEELEKKAAELPIIKIVDTLIHHAVLQRASDIHIEPLENEVVARYRIDGILRDAMILPKQIASSIVARVKVLASLRLDEKRLPQDGRIKIQTEEYRISIRVSIFPVYDGEKAVLRLLPENSKGFTLETLGFHGEAIEILHKNIKRTIGMVLATGPTGSGKTTTLYTVLDILNTPEVNISTIEDPVEYRMPRVNQSQVKPDIGFTFANGLRSLLRQDPDIIMVGEIRDTETASLAINAALTGHLVLSTLHTSSAGGALPRLIDMKVEPFLIASTVNVIIAQRLVRQLYKSKKPFKLSKAELEQLSSEVDLDKVLKVLMEEKVVPKNVAWPEVPFYKPVPADETEDGYYDRISVHEVMQVSQGIRDLIVKNADSATVEEHARKEGMLTMVEDGIFKAVQGLTTIEEVMRVTQEVE